MRQRSRRCKKYLTKLRRIKEQTPRRIKNKQMNNTVIEMKNKLEGINSGITEAEEQISDLEERMVEFTAAKQNKEKE